MVADNKIYSDFIMAADDGISSYLKINLKRLVTFVIFPRNSLLKTQFRKIQNRRCFLYIHRETEGSNIQYAD